MTSNENLLVTTMEECGELTQAISKGLRFGLDAKNNNHIMEEYYQLAAMFDMLLENDIVKNLDCDVVNKIISDKQKKVKHYQEESRNLGRVYDEISIKL